MTPDEHIPFARPFIGKEEEEAALRVLRSGWLTTGAEALAFEREFAAFLHAPPPQDTGTPNAEGFQPAGIRALAVNSATSGLHLALEACGVGSGDLVLVPSLTFAATAEVARYLGADPVFVDVAPGTFHMDPAALEKTLRGLPAGRAKAVIPVHYGGLVRFMDEIMEIARRYGLKVIEDAAHSFPSLTATEGERHSPRFAGTIGDAGVFSFYATKTITTGEGGMIVTRDAAIAERVSVMRSHGIDRSVWNRYSDAAAPWYYEVVAAGYKCNLPDLLAAVGRAQLAKAWDLLRERRRIAAAYDGAFSGDPRFVLPPTAPGDARHLYSLRLSAGVSRDEFVEKLKCAGIGASVHFIPLHVMPFYRERYGLSAGDLPCTMESFLAEVSLPIWPGMGEERVARVIAAVRASC